ncbi:hypothetical protein Fmac_002413 [Flemingia macrophylla]|uniref:Protein kinase domain-containing protein n=1 Tax=Flemingia macrophylla TaxID=520843 RepID=A0ABD1NKN0_9FABA
MYKSNTRINHHRVWSGWFGLDPNWFGSDQILDWIGSDHRVGRAEAVAGLDRNFGFSKHFGSKYDVGDEVGRGHFGYTCVAKVKKGEMKGQQVAVKVIPKAKRRERPLSRLGGAERPGAATTTPERRRSMSRLSRLGAERSGSERARRGSGHFLDWAAAGPRVFFQVSDISLSRSLPLSVSPSRHLHLFPVSAPSSSPCFGLSTLSLSRSLPQASHSPATTPAITPAITPATPRTHMTTAIAIEDVRREVKILRSLTGHNNLVQFYDAYEDHDNVYIVMELCEGGELLDRILSRGGKYTEEDAKVVLRQILHVVAFCHLQGVVHRDLKLENFLFTSKEENSKLKAIDFGLSDFVKPDERLNDIVGSAFYVAPEVLHRAYSTEADAWSIGVIAYILLCGSRPFWARTESGICLAVLKADPCFEEPPWPSLSDEARNFVERLLNKDPRHPWITSKDVKVPLDILTFKLMKAYMRSSSLRKAALRALSKMLTVGELIYLSEQFALLEPNKNGTISLESIKAVLMVNATDAMKESRIPDFLASQLNALQYRRMDFDEFCAAALSVHQLEALDQWEQHARCAYELCEKDGNKAIVIDELASELGLGPSVPVHAVLHDWIRHTDGKLSFLGFVKLSHGPSRSLAKAQ